MLKRAILSGLQPFTENHVYTVRRGLAKGLQRRGGLGFLRLLGSQSREEAFLETLDLRGKIVYDVGGYEGIITLFFARRVGPTGQVVTFEPHPRNHARIVENVRLNGFTNVKVHRLAIGSAPGRATLVFPADETARGSLVGDIQDQIRQEHCAAVVDIEIDSIDRQIEGGAPSPHFIKIDVEGLEHDVIEGMARLIALCHPTLYIEMHGATVARKLENATLVIEHLWRADYRVHHVESDTAIRSRGQIASAIEGHLHCT